MFMPSVSDCRGALALSWKVAARPTTEAQFNALTRNVQIAKFAVMVLKAFALVSLVGCVYSAMYIGLPTAGLYGLITIICAVIATRWNGRLFVAESDLSAFRDRLLLEKEGQLLRLAAADWQKGVPDMPREGQTTITISKDQYAIQNLKEISAMVKMLKERPDCRGVIATIREKWETYVKGQVEDEFLQFHIPYCEIYALCLYQETFGFEKYTNKPFTLKFVDGEMKVPAYAKMMLSLRSLYFQNLSDDEKKKSVITLDGVNMESFQKVVRYYYQWLPMTSADCEKTNWISGHYSWGYSDYELKHVYPQLCVAYKLQFQSAIPKLKEKIKSGFEVMYVNTLTRKWFHTYLDFWKTLGSSEADLFFKDLIEKKFNDYMSKLPDSEKGDWDSLVKQLKEAKVPDWVDEDDIDVT